MRGMFATLCLLFVERKEAHILACINTGNNVCMILTDPIQQNTINVCSNEEETF